jgi:xanthine dehydrogenase accessory factor
LQSKLPVWQLIYKSLLANKQVMLLYVLESKGSSPGRQGFCMSVNEDGEMAGSLGGGIMEHKFVELARKKIASAIKKKNTVLKKQIHNKTAKNNRSGMICSGEQTIFIYPISSEEKKIIQSIVKAIQQESEATLTISPKSITLSKQLLEQQTSLQWLSESNFIYQENVGYLNELHIIGGGHCALAFSSLMRKMDFKIHIYETRKDLNTLVQNKFAHKKIYLKKYDELVDYIPDGKNVYIVIMTFGYRTDAIALQSLINKKVKYFGVLGSRNKMLKMFEELKEKGISASSLKQLHAPIGIPIKSQTPEEIAVSIAAEIIQVKNAEK